jgi:hypothetical protein
MAPTMPVSAPLAGGSRNAIVRCGATRCLRMQCASVGGFPGVATSSIRRMEPIWQDSCSKQALPGILTAWSCLTSGYQLSNDHRTVLFVLLVRYVTACTNRPLPNRLPWLLARLPALSPQAPSQRDFVQTDVLDGRPDNGQTTGFCREHINLIGALSYIAEQARSAHWWSECGGAS